MCAALTAHVQPSSGWCCWFSRVPDAPRRRRGRRACAPGSWRPGRRVELVVALGLYNGVDRRRPEGLLGGGRHEASAHGLRPLGAPPPLSPALRTAARALRVWPHKSPVRRQLVRRASHAATHTPPPHEIAAVGPLRGTAPTQRTASPPLGWFGSAWLPASSCSQLEGRPCLGALPEQTRIHAEPTARARPHPFRRGPRSAQTAGG